MIKQGKRVARQDIKQLQKIKVILDNLHALPVYNEETNRKIDINQIESAIQDLLIRYGHLLGATIEYCDDCSGCLCHDEHGDCADEEEEDFCDECSLYLSECDCCSDCGYSECSCEDEEEEYSREPAMKKTVREVAEELAKAHKLDDMLTTAVYFEDGVDNEVRLVEVSDSLSNGGPGEVLPYRFPPGEGVPFPSVVVLLSPSEWSALENDDLKLPEGWNKANLKKVGCEEENCVCDEEEEDCP